MKLEIEFPDYVNRFKAHVGRHKTPYFIGTMVVVSGVTFIVTKKIVGPSTISPIFNNTINPVFNNDNSSLVNFGGHTTKIVKRTSDGKTWGTVTEAASEAGVSLPYMSRHLNGKEADVYNQIYKIIGIGTTG